MKPLVAGVDCHAETHTVVVLDGLGRTVGELVVSTDREAFIGAREQVEQWGAAHDAVGVVWGVETQGSLATPGISEMCGVPLPSRCEAVLPPSSARVVATNTSA